MKSNTLLSRKHRIATTIFIFIGMAGFILLHHADIHDGLFYEEHDLQNAIYNLIKSHEGFLVLIGIVGTSAVTGHYVLKK